MCEQGNLTRLAFAETGPIEVDSCIAPLVSALNSASIPTRASCCGHSHTVGCIALADGRELVIMTYEQARAVERLIGRDIQGNRR